MRRAHLKNLKKAASCAVAGLWMTLTILGLGLTTSGRALAAQPSVQQCLEASDASLELETEGKLLAARAALRICGSPSCPREIQAECVRRIELIEREIPAIVCDVRDAEGRLQPGAHITVDGLTPASASNGLIELDPGTYRIVAAVSGSTASRSVSVNAGDRNQRVLITLGRPSTPVPRSVAAPTPSSWAPRRIAALAVGGAGVASLGVASVFAVIAVDRKRDAESICSKNPCSSSEGVDRWQSAWKAGNLTTAFAVGGGVAAAVAVGLWFSVDEQRSTTIGLGPGRIQLRASF